MALIRVNTLARMISHKTFVHLDAIENRARGEVQQNSDQLAWYRVGHNVESYMLHQGKKFVKRFDANTYLRIADMWLRFDPLRDAKVLDYEALFARSKAAEHHYLVFSIDSDFCFYPEEQAELVSHLEKAGVSNMHITVHSSKGHDSFPQQDFKARDQNAVGHGDGKHHHESRGNHGNSGDA
jgi:homoserine O-acetyltransferase